MQAARAAIPRNTYTYAGDRVCGQPCMRSRCVRRRATVTCRARDAQRRRPRARFTMVFAPTIAEACARPEPSPEPYLSPVRLIHAAAPIPSNCSIIACRRRRRRGSVYGRSRWRRGLGRDVGRSCRKFGSPTTLCGPGGKNPLGRRLPLGRSSSCAAAGSCASFGRESSQGSRGGGLVEARGHPSAWNPVGAACRVNPSRGFRHSRARHSDPISADCQRCRRTRNAMGLGSRRNRCARTPRVAATARMAMWPS